MSKTVWLEPPVCDYCGRYAADRGQRHLHSGHPHFEEMVNRLDALEAALIRENGLGSGVSR